MFPTAQYTTTGTFATADTTAKCVMSWVITLSTAATGSTTYNAYATPDTVNGKLTASGSILTTHIGNVITGTADPLTPKGTALTDSVA